MLIINHELRRFPSLSPRRWQIIKQTKGLSSSTAFYFGTRLCRGQDSLFRGAETKIRSTRYYAASTTQSWETRRQRNCEARDTDGSRRRRIYRPLIAINVTENSMYKEVHHQEIKHECSRSGGLHAYPDHFREPYV